MNTKRTILSKPTQSDYNDLLDLYTNESVREYLGGKVAKSDFDKKFKDFFTTQLPECYWIVREKGTNKFIGLVSISRHHDEEHFEISYEIKPSFWGKGYGAEVVQKVINYAFSELNLKEIYAETQKKNLNSIKLLEKLDFTLINKVERFGEQQLIYSITNSKIIIIGTLHANITPNNELKQVLENYNPDQLLIEISNDDIENKSLINYPPEMQFAANWAKQNNVEIKGFDSKINVFKDGITPQDNEKVILQQKKIIKSMSWKEFNKKENEKLLQIPSLKELIDPKKEKMREKEMLENIKNHLKKKGTILIITGTSHLDFFEKNIKEAIFPFRY